MTLFLMSLLIKTESRNNIEFLLPGITRNGNRCETDDDLQVTHRTLENKNYSMGRQVLTIASEGNKRNKNEKN